MKNNCGLDFALVQATEQQNAAAVEQYLKDIKSQNTVNNCFEHAVYVENIELVVIFLSLSPRPDESMIVRMFHYVSQLGTNPVLIHTIQKHLPPAELAEAYRLHRDRLRYMVSINEPEHLTKFRQKMSDFEQLKSSRHQATALNAHLRQQSYVNDTLFDAVCCDARLMVQIILQSSAQILSQVTINESFLRCLKRRNFALADLLATCIDQQGYDEAVSYAVLEEEVFSFQWLLSGLLGFYPSQQLLDKLFVRISLRTSYNSDILKYMTILASLAAKNDLAAELHRRELEQRRLLHRQAAFRPAQHDIHAYARMNVNATPMDTNNETVDAVDASALNSRVAHRIGVNDAVLEHIRTRIPNETYSLNEVTQQCARLIRSHFSTDTSISRAVRVIGQVLNSRTVDIFGSTLRFLSFLPPASTATWIEGFLSESIEMHSCNPGALERVVTGLRGVGDPQLDAIFSQAEGPMLGRAFLTGRLNIFCDDNNAASKQLAKRNAQHLAEQLVAAHITLDSSRDEVRTALVEYVRAALSHVMGDISPLQGDLISTIEVVMDGYDTHLLPYLSEAIAKANGDITE